MIFDSEIDLIHTVLKESVHQDKTLAAVAKYQKIGHLNINDLRSTSSYGRVSDPEDILGIVRLENGEMVPGTYQRYFILLTLKNAHSSDHYQPGNHDFTRFHRRSNQEAILALIQSF